MRYAGVSNWAAWRVAKAQGIAERRGLARIASLQAYYTVAGRDLEREIVPMLESEGVGLMVWSPLAGGLLSGKYDGEGQAPTAGGPASIFRRWSAAGCRGCWRRSGRSRRRGGRRWRRWRWPGCCTSRG